MRRRRPADRCHLLTDDGGAVVATYQGQELDGDGRRALLDVVATAKQLATTTRGGTAPRQLSTRISQRRLIATRLRAMHAAYHRRRRRWRW